MMLDNMIDKYRFIEHMSIGYVNHGGACVRWRRRVDEMIRGSREEADDTNKLEGLFFLLSEQDSYLHE